MYIAKLMFHKWEEDIISGVNKGFNGTFAIFFYSCNMRCVYCQNSKISHIKKSSISAHIANPNDISDFTEPYHKYIFTIDELSNEMLLAEKNNAYSVSFITGVLYTNEIVETIKLARKKGLTIPIVYNSSGYETVSELRKLDGLIDIYLPDFKYFDNSLGKLYSKVPNYVDVAKLAIAEMYRQVGNNLIVRHLVLPAHTEDSKKTIKYLYDTYGDNIYLSIMSQYTPILSNKGIKEFSNLQRKLTKREYNKVTEYAISLGIKNAFIQEGDVAKESFIPDF